MFVLTCRRSPPRRIRRIWGLGGPGSLQTLAEPAQEVDQGTKKGRRAALEAPRRTDARQLPHEQPEVEATDVHEQAFEDIGMAAQMHPAHAPGLVEMSQSPPVDQGTKKGRRAAQAPRRTDASQLPHEQPEVEATDVHEQAFEDIGMAAQMHPAMPPVS